MVVGGGINEVFSTKMTALLFGPKKEGRIIMTWWSRGGHVVVVFNILTPKSAKHQNPRKIPNFNL